MQALSARIAAAETLWAQAREAEQAGNHRLAYEKCTEAHDLIMDCARLHQKAHEHLRRINLKLGNYGELLTDWALHFLAPLGIFSLISRLARTEAFGSKICARGSQGGPAAG